MVQVSNLNGGLPPLKKGKYDDERKENAMINDICIEDKISCDARIIFLTKIARHQGPTSLNYKEEAGKAFEAAETFHLVAIKSGHLRVQIIENEVS